MGPIVNPSHHPCSSLAERSQSLDIMNFLPAREPVCTLFKKQENIRPVQVPQQANLTAMFESATIIGNI